MKKLSDLLKFIFRSIGFLIGKLIIPIPIQIKKHIYILCSVINSILPGWLYMFSYDFTMALANSSHHSLDKDIFVTKEIMPSLKLGLDVSKKTQRQIFISKIYEPHITNYLKKNGKNADLFVDVGANVGYYSLMMSHIMNETGSVLAFEPEKENFNRLEKNLSLTKNSHLFDAALSDNGGEGVLNINPENDGGHSLEHGFSGENSSRCLVKKLIFDAMLPILGPIDNKNIILKIDVEGYELNVLKGMGKFLSTRAKIQIICEISKNEKEIFDYLKQKGFVGFLINHQGEPIKVKEGENKKRDYLFKNSF